MLAPAGAIVPLSLGFVLRVLTCLLPHRYFTKKVMCSITHDAIHNDKANLDVVDDAIDLGYTAIRCFCSRRLVNSLMFEDEQLKHIDVPTLCLLGENERLFSGQKAAKRLMRVALNIKTVVAQNAGYDLYIAQAQLVNKMVLEFLRKDNSTIKKENKE